MNLQIADILSITEAREKLGRLAERAFGQKYFVLTVGGEPEVALVDINYLNKLEETVKKIYQKTYIDPRLMEYTREFSGKETSEWLEEDKLN